MKLRGDGWEPAPKRPVDRDRVVATVVFFAAIVFGLVWFAAMSNDVEHCDGVMVRAVTWTGYTCLEKQR